MIEGVYKWVGLVVGGLCALLATSALIQELLGASPDPGSVAFDLVFGGVLLLTGALLYALSSDSVEPPSPVMIAIILVLGVVMTVPSAVLLWLQREQPRR